MSLKRRSYVALCPEGCGAPFEPVCPTEYCKGRQVPMRMIALNLRRNQESDDGPAVDSDTKTYHPACPVCGEACDPICPTRGCAGREEQWQMHAYETARAERMAA